ncbi:TetR family transcriptional regulator [Nocardia sp. NPDC005978]|uniref:TetR/AcrR family transcriptional regulator n=1 Tax=Nocardia sp. NPDC005978 TaxID=3156725 RepID=UPI0033AD00D7
MTTSTLDRRTRIVDSAIDLVAAQGLRALTHRALDTALELPPGSTSYYFRTKRALIEAIVDHIALRSRSDFAAAGEALRVPGIAPGAGTSPGTEPSVSGPSNSRSGGGTPGDSTSGDIDIPALALGIADWLDRLLAQRRNHLIVRHALIIELQGDEELHAKLVGCLFSHRHATELYRALGSRSPAEAAADFIAVIEGLVFDRFAGARTTLVPGTPESRRQLTRVLTIQLRAHE